MEPHRHLVLTGRRKSGPALADGFTVSYRCRDCDALMAWRTRGWHDDGQSQLYPAQAAG